MNTFLWILQGLLAAMFLIAGTTKVTQPRPKLQAQLPWVEDYSVGTVRIIGVVELLAAIGLVLPASLDIAPILTPLAAAGLALLMVLAINVHRLRREPAAIAFNAGILLVATIVAVLRFGPNSF